MRKIMLLRGVNFQEALPYIKDYARDDPWLVLNNPDLPLHEYLTRLHDDFGLRNSILSRLRICRNLVWQPGEILYQAASGRTHQPANMLELLRLLRDSVLPEIIAQNDNRALLAEIAQQLVYLDYPLNRVRINIGSARRSPARYDEDFAALAQIAAQTLAKLANLPPRGECDAIYTSIDACRGLLSLRAAGPLRLAVAASKKSGKSTLLNCLLDRDIAPSSCEIATPNSCEYSPSPDSLHHLRIGKEKLDFGSAAALKKRMEMEFNNAQRNAENGFGLPDMAVEYPGRSRLPGGWILVDTPGPDAAGTSHRASAEKALAQCDAAIFLIDYSKYLTGNEHDYLSWVKNVFARKRDFNTLVFAINKMDMALQDQGAKSWVKSLDFIRCRLKDIDPNYAECLIFPISALNYANLLTLEQAAATQSEIANLLKPDAKWDRAASRLCRSLEDDLPEDILAAFVRLAGEAERMEDILGLNEPMTKEIRNLSGVPRLMDYTFGRIEASTEAHDMLKRINLCREEIAKISSILATADADVKNACQEFLNAWTELGS